MRHLLPLQYIEAIAKYGSIRKAADRLSITPSALNRRLLSMEEELGVLLFERLPAGVRLTTAGEIMLDHIRNQISDMQRVQSRIADLSGMRRGHVSIACSPEALGQFLPNQIKIYRDKFPGVTFQLNVCARGEAEAALADHSADIALVFEPMKLADFQILFTLKQPISCIVEKSHPLASQKTVRLYECVDYPLLLPSQPSGVRHLLEGSAARLGLNLRSAVSANNLQFLQEYALNDDHISFDIPINLPLNMNERDKLSIAIDSRDVPPGFLFVGHLRGRTLPVAAARFLEDIVEALAKYDE
ncbi:MAG: hypothetical protein COB78_03420 [Hyphomicrobiales bacterium]|nr:MAG: hypothetical protein COB78_03420 [Hyphomicrobiales bacterium]